MANRGAYNWAKENHDLILRIGFGIFLLIWGLDRFFRAEDWATESLMGHFYGNLGMQVVFVAGLGIVQVLIALSFFSNILVKYSSLLLLAMLIVSTIITIQPMMNYLINGGAPIPAILFSDHFPLLAGGWAIFAHSK
ncbi:MAG: hypothetical protein K940chlam3_01145 [Chlamydiae bacterium]|nr:hypothetical protein [Chlamydiota bacterium]